jgi:hypothetical protein
MISPKERVTPCDDGWSDVNMLMCAGVVHDEVEM